MNRFRPALNAILGLLLMVQGIAVASAGGSIVGPGDSASAVAAAAMPCHGDQSIDADQQSCCDSDCPNMTSCALGHLAVATAQSFESVAARHPTQRAFVPAPVTFPPPSLLRPPIVLHV